ncbi:hypothetical protein [Nocardia abscessus]|uniref:hypothetical protein n=1 Tax=Nocardia abscessus TaxID=120957 RepID=UPI0024577B06|nr:hypothetical protein [Nocardia abscessus]
MYYRSEEELLYQISRAGHLDTLERVRTAIASAQDPAGQLLAVMKEFTIHHARAHTVARITSTASSPL